MSPEQQVVGNWVADANSVQLPDLPVPGMAEKAKAAMGTTNLKLSADKTFNLAAGNQNVSGKWTLEENTVRLTPNSGAGDATDIKLTLSPDKSSMDYTMPIPIGEVKITLKKSG